MNGRLYACQMLVSSEPGVEGAIPTEAALAAARLRTAQALLDEMTARGEIEAEIFEESP
jgi:hypothetical protein